jgi:hypothetical protein
LLLATPGSFALSGVPPANYSLGVNNFFDTTGDTLTFAEGLDTLAFGSGAVPLDSLNSLVRTSPVTNSPVTTAVNSPTNVAGLTGAFPRWENQDNRFDINGNGRVNSGDVVQVVSRVLTEGPHALGPPTAGNSPPPFLDPNGSNTLSSSRAMHSRLSIVCFARRTLRSRWSLHRRIWRLRFRNQTARLWPCAPLGCWR